MSISYNSLFWTPLLLSSNSVCAEYLNKELCQELISVRGEFSFLLQREENSYKVVIPICDSSNELLLFIDSSFGLSTDIIP